MVSAVVVRGFDGHRERFMITGICYGFAPVGAAWSVGVLLVGAGPVGLVEHRPRRPEAARSLSLDRAAGITRPIESASTLMPPGMLRGPKAAAARSARCTWVCVDMHTECASPETHLKANVSRRLRRAVANCEQPTEQPTHWAITDPCTRPRTWPRSAITRRTPRLRLVMRRSGVRFPKAALRAFAPGLPQQPPTCVRQPRQVRCRPSPQGSCEPAVALTFKYRANQSLQLDTLRQRSPQGTNTVVPPRLDGAPRV